VCIGATLVFSGCTKHFCCYDFLQHAFTNTVALSTKVNTKRNLLSIYACHETRTSQLIWWCRYRLDSRGTRVQLPESARIFLSSNASISAVGSTQHPIQSVPEALSLQCSAGHLSLSTANFKNQWSYTSMSHMHFWIVWAQIYLTFILVNVWYQTTNRWNCTVLVTNSSTVHICNCPWDIRMAFMVISLHVTCKPGPIPFKHGLSCQFVTASS
jgi:hypothetical protein